MAWTVIRLRGDRTGEEQPLWLKPEGICLHMTMVYTLMDGGVDSGLKLVLKVYRPGELASPAAGCRMLGRVLC